MVRLLLDRALEQRPVARRLGLLVGDNQRTSPPAPAEGLYFVAASYPPGLFLPPETGVPEAEVSVSDA